MVTHAPLKESNHNNKDGLPPSGRPVLPSAAFTVQEQVGPVSFSKGQTAVGRQILSLGCVLQIHHPRAVRRPGREGLDLGGKGAASLGSGAQGAHLQGTGGLFLSCLFFFFNFPHPVRPNPPEPGAEPARRGGRGPRPAKRDSPARVVAAAGRQVGKGEAGAARRATRELGGRKGGWASGETRQEMAAAESVRRRLPGRHALDPGASYSRAQGASGHRASWAVGVGRARPAPRGSAPPPASARGAGVRGLRPAGGAPGPCANRKRPRPSRAAVWAGSGRVGGARPRHALGLRSGVSLPRRAWGLGLSRWVGGVKVPSTARP